MMSHQLGTEVQRLHVYINHKKMHCILITKYKNLTRNYKKMILAVCIPSLQNLSATNIYKLMQQYCTFLLSKEHVLHYECNS